MLRKISAILLLALALSCLPIFSVAAERPDSLSFDVANIYNVSAAYEEELNTFEATVLFPESMDPAMRGGVILGNFGHGNPNVSFEVYTNGNPRLYITDASGNVTNLVFNNINLYNGEKTHVAIVRDASAKLAYCYINGELKQTLPCYYTAEIKVTHPLVVGGDVRSGNTQYFKGELYYAALYSSARSADEVALDAKEYSLCDELIALYSAEDMENDAIIPDMSGNSYDAKKKMLWFDEKEEVSDFAYSFAVIGDTQVVAKKYPDEFHKIYDYILDNLEEKNIQFVLGLGDITDTDSYDEWELAKENIFRLDGKVPYSLVRGNHDSKANFNGAFPYSKYESVLSGSFDGTMINTWQELTLGEVDYIIFTLDYGASNAVLNWASEIIKAHPKHNVIITTHAYLYRDGTTLDQGDVCPPATTGGSNNGDHMWDKLIRKYENIVLVISGHDPCDKIVMAQDKGDGGNTVTQLLIDPQGVDAAQGATGLVAILYFSEDGREVTVEYYSTVREQYFMEENQFSFTLDLAGDEVIPKQYKLKVTSPVEILNKLSETYEEGDIVTVKLAALTEQYFELYLNGKKVAVAEEKSDGEYTYFKFAMPDRDSTVKIKAIDVESPTDEAPTDAQSETSATDTSGGCGATVSALPICFILSLASLALVNKRRIK